MILDLLMARKRWFGLQNTTQHGPMTKSNGPIGHDNMGFKIE